MFNVCYSNKVGWSRRSNFRTPPATGATEVKVIMLSDMGGNERDSSNEHYLQGRPYFAQEHVQCIFSFAENFSTCNLHRAYLFDDNRKGLWINADRKEVDAGDVAAIFHTGDISYAIGFLLEWDAFLEMINPVASRVPCMTASGNHER